MTRSLLSIQIDISEPLPDEIYATGYEGLICDVRLEGERIGEIELPVCTGRVDRIVLVDAIVAEMAWRIMGHFLERTVYPKLRLAVDTTGFKIFRGDLFLGHVTGSVVAPSWSAIHDKIGWTVFLQEFWGIPGWLGEQFYQAGHGDPGSLPRIVDDGWIVLEASQPLPAIKTPTGELDVLFKVGGAAIGVVNYQADNGVVDSQTLRAGLTEKSGMELCRVAVREGLLELPLGWEGSLRDRLEQRAAQVESLPEWRNVGIPAAVEDTILLCRREAYSFNTSVCRRATFPPEMGELLVNSAFLSGETVIYAPGSVNEVERVIYTPDVVRRPSWKEKVDERRPAIIHENVPPRIASYDRGHFETLFATQADPWKYTSPYEQVKYEQTLAILPAGVIEHAMELACAEGHFTIQLVKRVQHLFAADISRIALERAADRCKDYPQVEFLQLDMNKDSLPGGLDLIVCSEVLYFTGTLDKLKVVGEKISNALLPGGHLLAVHMNLVVDELGCAGFDWDLPFGAQTISRVLGSIPELRLVTELNTPLYRIQMFQRMNSTADSSSEDVETINTDLMGDLRADFAEHALWHGGKPHRKSAETSLETWRMPVLMYHRVACEGSIALRRWRVTPLEFEEQLHYLKDAGYESAQLEDWSEAVKHRRPLPGKKVLITFDDGYVDFADEAWPLLQKYGFGAQVFLVAGLIGETNRWDERFGDNVALMNWPEIYKLQAQGVRFESHSLNHRAVTELSHCEAVLEMVRSRTVLQAGLGKPIKAFAYPFGLEDRIARHWIGACGYTFGFTARNARVKFADSLLALPRLEVRGDNGFDEFVRTLADSKG